MKPSMRIDVSLAEWPKSCGSPSDELRDRLSNTPTKDPEEIAQQLASRTARTEMLYKLEMEARTERARRANDLVKENKARKLRMEAAAVARATSKIEQATKVESTRRQEHQAKRQAAAARRTALFEAVRAARESRQVLREARQAELAKLELNAASLREKKLATTVGKSSAAVKHALEVAASLKVKEKEELAAKAARLTERLSAANSRRQDVLAATAEGAASVVHAAEKIRLRHLYDEKASIEERRVRLAKAMDKALGRREAKIQSITSRAAVENARVAGVVADTRMNADTTMPATKRHALTARLQAAEVRRLETFKKKPSGVLSRDATPKATPTITPVSSPDGSPQASPGKLAPPTPWSDKSQPDKALRPMKLFKPHPVIVIDTEPFHFAGSPPTTRLLNRLQFRPRLLLATASARQAAAAGRRAVRINLIRARANHYGTVRVAATRGRKAAVAEYRRAIFELREAKGSRRAAGHKIGKAQVAAKLGTQRVVSAKLRRSSLRLAIVNGAIAKEQKRIAASERKAASLSVVQKNRWEEAKTFAARFRRAAATERLVSRSGQLEKRCVEAAERRDAALAAVIFRARRGTRRHAKLAAMRRVGPAEGTTEIAVQAQMEPEVEAEANADAEKRTEAEAEKKAAPPMCVAEDAVAEDAVAKDEPDIRIAQLKALLEARLQLSVEDLRVFDLNGEPYISPVDEHVAKQRAELAAKAAEVSNLAAAKAAARVEAKEALKAEAAAVKKALNQAAAKAGLHGREAKAEATEAEVPSSSSSTATSPEPSFVVVSDRAEEWHVVTEKA